MIKYFLAPLIALLIHMTKTIPAIRDNYTVYCDLKDNRKFGTDKVIDLSTPKRTNKNFLINDQVFLRHTTLENKIIFISEVKVRDYKYFQFKLRCKDFCDPPFFRYDSDGDTHRNYDENIPLREQQITTPHFHYFNSKGIEIAYKTEKLLDDKEKAALEDISLCVVHFCHEGNIRIDDEGFPEITILSGTLGLKHTEDDPNSGVNFI